MVKVTDTILYTTEPRSPIRTVAIHPKTKRGSRLSDGMEHPVTIRRIKPGKPSKLRR